MATARPELPVDAALPRLLDALRRRPVVILEAPPGTGKTTRVPPALLEQPWLGDQRVVLLEPRRVAARAAARRIAGERSEAVGDTVGIRTRNHTRVGPETRIEVVTEGVLTRMLLADPSLAGIGAVIFDEFHERSIHADTALAFTRETMAALRPDLRVVVMSATLESSSIAARLHTDAIVRVDAERHPVVTRHDPPQPGERIDDAVVRITLDALRNPAHAGDLLVFLPGAGMINRAERQLRDRLEGRLDQLSITPLHGSLPPERQDAALPPDPDGRRKIILATPIAETSVTIDGVATVIASGLRRRPEIDQGRGMSRLRTVVASRAAADQRAGRAGRQQAGTCIRLWPSADDVHRPAAEPPEITTADLTSLALDLAAWGATDVLEVPWLQSPPAPGLDAARATLRALGALDVEHRLTEHGRAMIALGTDPRLAHLLTRSIELEEDHPGAIATASALAAALADRDLLRGRDRPTDLRRRLDLLLADRPPGPHDRAAIEQARAAMRQWLDQLRAQHGATVGPADLDLTGVLTSIAFPDRIARRRADDGHFLLASGAGVTMRPDDDLAREEWLAVAETDGTGGDARVVTAAPIGLGDVESLHADRLDEVDHGGWDRRSRDVVFERRLQLGAIIVSRRPDPSPSTEAVIAGLLEGVRREGLGVLGWGDADRRFRERLAFAHEIAPHDWPAADDTSLLESLDEWLTPHLSSASRRRDLDALPARTALASLLDWRQSRDLDRLVPTHVDVPSGSRIPIDYGAEGGPVLAVRLQEVFGLSTSPTVFDGQVPLVVHLLSPAHRPVQVTRDLASFWAEGYAEVRKELRGRYPKHHWPEDPTTAPATNRAKRRS